MTILPNGVAVVDEDTHHAIWCAELGLVHDRWMADEICKHIKQGDVVIEGGANIGTLTRAMIDAGATVYAFEPNSDASKCLYYNCPETFIDYSALGEEYGNGKIIRSLNAGASFIIESDRPDTEITTIDIEGKSPSLIKLDIEGYEVKALRGAIHTIARCRPVLIIEVNRFALERAGDSRQDLFNLLEEYDYGWRIIQPDCEVNGEQYDIECLPKEKIIIDSSIDKL